MKTCATCKKWEKGESRWGECHRATETQEHPPGPDVWVDADGYDCADLRLETTPDFGCVLWEEKG